MTKQQRAVLAHVVIDPDQWLAHAVATFGDTRAETAVTDKVAKWTEDYATAIAAEGAAYKTRAEREGA